MIRPLPGGSNWRGHLLAVHGVQPGDNIDLKLPLDRLYLFDAETGEAVKAASAAAGA